MADKAGRRVPGQVGPVGNRVDRVGAVSKGGPRVSGYLRLFEKHTLGAEAKNVARKS